MKVLVEYKDIRVYRVVVEVESMNHVCEELINCTTVEEFIEPPEEINGHLEIISKIHI